MKPGRAADAGPASASAASTTAAAEGDRRPLTRASRRGARPGGARAAGGAADLGAAGGARGDGERRPTGRRGRVGPRRWRATCRRDGNRRRPPSRSTRPRSRAARVPVCARAPPRPRGRRRAPARGSARARPPRRRPRAGAAGRDRATARSNVTAASATHRARGSPGTSRGRSSTNIDQQEGSRTTMRPAREGVRGQAVQGAPRRAPARRPRALREEGAPAAAGVDDGTRAPQAPSTSSAASPMPGSR